MSLKTVMAAQRFFQQWTDLVLGTGEVAFTVEIDVDSDYRDGGGCLTVRSNPSEPEALVMTDFEVMPPGSYRGMHTISFRAPRLQLAGKVGLDGEVLMPDPGAELTAAGLGRLIVSRLSPAEQQARFATATEHLLAVLSTELSRENSGCQPLTRTAAPLLRLDRVWAEADSKLALLARVVSDCVEDLVLNQMFRRTPDLTMADVSLAVLGLRRLVSQPDLIPTGSSLPLWPYVRFIHKQSEMIRIEVRDLLDEEEERDWGQVHRSFFAIVPADEEVLLAHEFQQKYPALPFEAARELARAELQRRVGATATFFFHAKRAIEPLLRERLGAYVRQTILPRGNLTLGWYPRYLEGPGRFLLNERVDSFIEGLQQFVQVRNEADHGNYYDPSPKLMEQAWTFLHQPDSGLSTILSIPIAS